MCYFDMVSTRPIQRKKMKKCIKKIIQSKHEIENELEYTSAVIFDKLEPILMISKNHPSKNSDIF